MDRVPCNRTNVASMSNTCFKIQQLHDTIAGRRCYHKTDVYMATNDHRVGPANINETYEWASHFLDCLGNTFGHAKVDRKLSKWRWDCTTAFSGVGCAESVKTSIPCSLFITHKFQPMLANPRPCTACKLLPGRRPKVLKWRTFDSIGHVNGIQHANVFWVQHMVAVASEIS